MTILSEIAALLNTTEKNVPARLIGMRIAPVCERCGGCGSYSFNQIDGSICYGCNGKGHTRPTDKQLPAMLEATKEAINSGAFAAYLRVMDARRICKTAERSVMDAWSTSNVAKLFHGWASHVVRDDAVEGFAIARAANDIMYEAYNTVSKATRSLNPRSETYDADVITVAELATAKIAEIKAADIAESDFHPALVEFVTNQKAFAEKRNAERRARGMW